MQIYILITMLGLMLSMSSPKTLNCKRKLIHASCLVKNKEIKNCGVLYCLLSILYCLRLYSDLHVLLGMMASWSELVCREQEAWGLIFAELLAALVSSWISMSVCTVTFWFQASVSFEGLQYLAQSTLGKG